jgi:hypothetical protein
MAGARVVVTAAASALPVAVVAPAVLPAFGPRGAVPRDTTGISETGKPDSGEMPGCAGATLKPDGSGARSPAGVGVVFGGPSVLRTERLGMVGLMFGVPGAEPRVLPVVPVVIPVDDVAASAAVEMDVLPGVAVVDDAAPEDVAPVDVPPADPVAPPAPADPVAPPAPPPVPPPPWAQTGPRHTLALRPAIRNSDFEFMTLLEVCCALHRRMSRRRKTGRPR